MTGDQQDPTNTIVRIADDLSKPARERLAKRLSYLVSRWWSSARNALKSPKGRRFLPTLFAIILLSAIALGIANRGKVNRIQREFQKTPYVSSMAFPRRADGAVIFESDQSEPYRQALPEDGAGVDYTPFGGLVMPPKVTTTNPARVVNRVNVDSSKAILFSLEFTKVVSRGHFQFAFGAGRETGLTLQFAPDPSGKIVYLTAKQDDYYLPESASSMDVGKTHPGDYAVPLFPTAKEFWVVLRINKKTVSVSLPSHKSSKPLTYKLIAEPELDQSTTLERRSYGSEVQLKHLAIGTPEVIWSIADGRYQHDDWPDLVLGN